MIVMGGFWHCYKGKSPFFMGKPSFNVKNPHEIITSAIRVSHRERDLGQVASQLRRQATLGEAQESVEGPLLRNSLLQNLLMP